MRLIERRGGCMGIPKLVVLLVLVLYSFLIISCFIWNKEMFSSPWYFSAYKMVSSTYKWYNSFNQNANSPYYWKPFYSRSKYIQRNNLFILFCCGKSFNDMDFAMVPLAWTHAQGRPQLLHCSFFSFTFPTFIFIQTS